jgi:hypothetical protein
VNRRQGALVTAGVVIAVGLVVAVALVVGSTGRSGESGMTRGTDRFVLPDAPRAAPSGKYTAHAEAGPEQNGVPTWVVVIRDQGGGEVFRDEYAYSTRHGVGITWLSTADQLWVLSADVGDAHVDPSGSGWVKTTLTPSTLDDKPEEIRRLSR